MKEYFVIPGLALIMGVVLLLPFSVKKVEEELEAFLFIMGIFAVSVSGQWSLHLVKEALAEPLKITLAVLAAGFLFRNLRKHISSSVDFLIKTTGLSPAIFIIIIILGFASSLITAIISALILAEVATALRLERKYEIRMVVCACFAIGLGAVFTPLGEPLSTIATAKLRTTPHNADFFYLLKLLWMWVVPGIFLCAAAACRNMGHGAGKGKSLAEDHVETSKDIILRSIKVYLFIVALIFLGTGISPIAEKTVAKAPVWALYWINSISAVLDNATLVAAEIVPSMSRKQLIFILMGLLISGGMLIPGNIPNIICSSKLGIKSREWAETAVPLGTAMMLVYFAVLMIAL